MSAQRVVITRIGGPEVLRPETFEPEPPGPGEIAIDVRAAGVNFADLFCRYGLYRAAPPLPFAPGFEVAGTVAQIGQGAAGDAGAGGDAGIPRGMGGAMGSAFAPGDRVIAVLRFGGYASRVNVQASLVRPLPAGWSLEEGAAFPVAFLTAYYGLVRIGRLAAGETVVVQSAAGGVGIAACQIARALGARVIGTVGSEAKRPVALGAGAGEVVVSPNYDVWGEIARRAEGLDLVFDAVGGPGLRRAYRLLRPGGRLVSYGFASAMPKGRWRNWPALLWRLLRRPRFDPLDMTATNRSVAGFNLVYLFDRLAFFEAAWDALMALAEAGRIRPVVGATFPFKRAAEAHALVQSRASTGKVVLVPEP